MADNERVEKVRLMVTAPFKKSDLEGLTKAREMLADLTKQMRNVSAAYGTMMAAMSKTPSAGLGAAFGKGGIGDKAKKDAAKVTEAAKEIETASQRMSNANRVLHQTTVAGQPTGRVTALDANATVRRSEVYNEKTGAWSESSTREDFERQRALADRKRRDMMRGASESQRYVPTADELWEKHRAPKAGQMDLLQETVRKARKEEAVKARANAESETAEYEGSQEKINQRLERQRKSDLLRRRHESAQLLLERSKPSYSDTESQYTHDIEGAGNAPDMDAASRMMIEARRRKYQSQIGIASRAQGEFGEMSQLKTMPSHERNQAATTARRYGNEVLRLQGLLDKTNLELRMHDDLMGRIGKNILQNVQHVTQWAASVGILYGSLALVNHAMSETLEITYLQARLQQIFKGTAQQARELSNAVLHLAASQGISGKEAMESAISWARLGLSQVQIMEAVRVSLLAANDARITTAEATEHLSSLTVVYNLRVQDLEATFSQLNNTSNMYNATTAQMLVGLTRTAAIAKQAGISLSELIGLMGTGIGSTGQTGANVGNAIKSMLGALAAPDKAEILRKGFRFEVSEGASMELKNMSEVLAGLFVKYKELSKAEREMMLFSVVGKQQASRMAAILDNYIQSQVIMISNLHNLNSAEQENTLIRNTAKAQLQGLITEFERFAKVQGEGFKGMGPLHTMTAMITGLKNLLALVNSAGGAGGIFVGVLTAMTLKLALTASMAQEAGGKTGILANSWRALGNAFTSFGQAVKKEWQRDLPVFLARMSSGSGLAARSMNVLSRSMMLMFRTVLPLAAIIVGIEVAMLAWNSIMEAVGLSSSTAEKYLDAFGIRAQAAGAKADAAAAQIKLLQTTFQAIGATRDQGDQSHMFAQAMEGYFPRMGGEQNPKDEEARKLAISGAVKQFEAVQHIADATERAAAMQALLNKMSEPLIEKQARELQQKRELNRLSQMTQESEIRRLRSLAGNNPSQERRKLIDDAEMKLGEIKKSAADSFTGEEQAFENELTHFREASMALNQHKEALKGIADALGEYYNALPGDSNVEKDAKHLSALNATASMLEEQINLLDDQKKKYAELGDAAGKAGDQLTQMHEANTSSIVGLEQEAFSAMKRIMTPTGDSGNPLGGLVNNMGGGGLEILKQIAPAGALSPEGFSELVSKTTNLGDLNQVEEIMGQIANERAKDMQIQEAQKRMMSDPFYKTWIGQLQTENEQLKQINIERGRMGTSQYKTMREATDNMNLRMGLMRAGVAGLGFGETPREQESARMKLLTERTDIHGDALAELHNAEEIDTRRLKMAQDFKQLAMEEYNIIVAKNREYQRGLLTRSPAELLRALAVNQVVGGGRGLSAGQFFAMDQSARGDIMSRPEFSSEYLAFRRGARATQNSLLGAGMLKPGIGVGEWRGRVVDDQAVGDASLQAHRLASTRIASMGNPFSGQGGWGQVIPEALRLQFSALNEVLTTTIRQFQRMNGAMPATATAPAGGPQFAGGRKFADISIY